MQFYSFPPNPPSIFYTRTLEFQNVLQIPLRKETIFTIHQDSEKRIGEDVHAFVRKIKERKIIIKNRRGGGTISSRSLATRKGTARRKSSGGKQPK